jgi:hypothetical protein
VSSEIESALTNGARPRVRTTRLLEVLAAAAGLDLVWVLLTREGFLGLGSPIGPAGLGLRLVALALLLVLRLRLSHSLKRPAVLARLSLIGVLLATLFQFHFLGPRVVGDGMMYYVYVRSLWKDFDLDFANEYQHYGLLRSDRSDLITPTKTGLRRSIFSIGPAVLWSPFFLAGEGVARVEHLAGRDVDLSGYGPIHWNAVALGSLLYGFGAVWLIHSFLLRRFGEAVAILTALLVWLATFLHWYMVHQPTYAHAPSAFLAALTLWLWDRERIRPSGWGSFVWGLCIGLAMCVRWQNGVFLFLPAVTFIAEWRRDHATLPRLVRSTATLSLGVILGAVPQMVAWKVLYDEWILRYPPHGAGFVRLDHPFLLETLFSSRHGLLSWTPVLWLGYLGFVLALRRRLPGTLSLLVPLLAMTYVNACAGDWWAGASFSNRRFDSCLPLLAFGLAAALARMRAIVERRPGLAVGVLLVPVVGWSLALAVLTRSDATLRETPEPFARLVGRTVRPTFGALGSPMTWPASWVFAAAHRCAPGRYDRLVGRYLFYRQNNLGGRIDLGATDDDALLGEGWRERELRDGITSRALDGSARLFAPLDVAERLTLRVRSRTTQAVSVSVKINGREAGRFAPTPEWSDSLVTADESFWHREVNEVSFTAGARVEVDWVEFLRSPQL